MSASSGYFNKRIQKESGKKRRKLVRFPHIKKKLVARHKAVCLSHGIRFIDIYAHKQGLYYAEHSQKA
jgi:DUF2075 family protein